MNPQQGTNRLPFLNSIAPTEPLGRSLVLTIGCNVVICRRVRRRLPISKTRKQLPPYEHVRCSTIGNNKNDDGRFMSSTLDAVVCMINFASVAVSFPSRQFKISVCR